MPVSEELQKELMERRKKTLEQLEHPEQQRPNVPNELAEPQFFPAPHTAKEIEDARLADETKAATPAPTTQTETAAKKVVDEQRKGGVENNTEIFK